MMQGSEVLKFWNVITLLGRFLAFLLSFFLKLQTVMAYKLWLIRRIQKKKCKENTSLRDLVILFIRL